MSDLYFTAYAVSFGAVFIPAALLYVVLRHCLASSASGDDERNERDGDG